MTRNIVQLPTQVGQIEKRLGLTTQPLPEHDSFLWCHGRGALEITESRLGVAHSGPDTSS